MPPTRERDGKKKKYRSKPAQFHVHNNPCDQDGTPIWERRAIDGPGIWASCIRGKEKQAIGELCDLFESIADELWPIAADPDTGELSIEDQIANEVSALKRPKAERRFVNCPTETDCVLFIACKAPVDPVKLVTHHIETVQRTGNSRTRYTQRLVPSSQTTIASPFEIRAMCNRVLPSFFSQERLKGKKYKIELRTRNHSVHSRQTIIDEIVKCVPEGFTVDLENADIFILVEVFKSVCGVSAVEDYYRLQKFNVMELAAKAIAE